MKNPNARNARNIQHYLLVEVSNNFEKAGVVDVPNSASFDDLTDEQQKASFVVRFVNINSFEARFELNTWPNTGRFFQFAGQT